MATTTQSATPMMDAVRERLMPKLHGIERNVRAVRRAAVRGRYAAEDFAAATHLAIRHRPVRTLTLVSAAGLLAGCVLGYGLGRRCATRTREGKGDA